MNKVQIRLKIIEKFGTQIRFAKEVGMREDVLSKVINGHRRLPDDQRKRWAKKLGCKMNDLPNEFGQ